LTIKQNYLDFPPKKEKKQVAKGRKIYVDAGTQGNGMPNQSSVIAVVANKKVVVSRGLGNYTVNEAEYSALIEGIKWAIKRKYKFPRFYTDSRLVERQIKRKWGIHKEHLVSYCWFAQNLLKQSQGELEWVPRELNLAGHYLENRYGL
jgi:ribonuclease HI